MLLYLPMSFSCHAETLAFLDDPEYGEEELGMIEAGGRDKKKYAVLEQGLVV